MIELRNCYIIDSLANIGKYRALSPNFKTACDFVAKGDFSALKPGKNVIDGEAVFVNDNPTNFCVQGERKMEFHRRYYDIHIPLDCDERIGLGVFDARTRAAYDAEKDVGFCAQEVDWFVIRKGEFCITAPYTCVHVPSVTTDTPKTVRKIVVKVEA